MVDKEYKKYELQIISRADPIICGHAEESRNLAESFYKLTGNKVSIVTYPRKIIKESKLPLRSWTEPYSKGVVVERPTPREDYKIIDGNIINAISGKIIENINKKKINAIMSLYIVPHSRIVLNSAETIKFFDKRIKIVTIAEAVGSDITNVVRSCLNKKIVGQAKQVFADYLSNDIPIAVSEFTKHEIIKYAKKIFDEGQVKKMEREIKVFYPTINADFYMNHPKSRKKAMGILREKGLPLKRFRSYLFFLSRLTKAKGLYDLVDAYKKVFKKLKYKPVLVIAGEGPAKRKLRDYIKKKRIPHAYLIGSVTENEKLNLMYGCRAFIVPTKPTRAFTETFGIVFAEKLLTGGTGLIVTCKTGGVPEATGDHCIYAKADNPNDLAEKIIKAVKTQRKKRLEINKKGQKYAFKNFDRRKTTLKILGEIEREAKNKKKSKNFFLS